MIIGADYVVATAAEKGARPCPQLTRPKRLFQVIIGTAIKCIDNMVLPAQDR